MPAPTETLGLRHVALYVENMADCKHFYCDIVGMTIEWQPDDDNVYLTSGHDNLALHRVPEGYKRPKLQTLDHIGFILPNPDAVDTWAAYMTEHDVRIMAGPKTHRDGARSFYCADPDGNVVQFIHHPPLAPV